MPRAAFVLIASALIWTVAAPAAQQGATARDLIGTWTLASMEERIETGTPSRVQNPRGLLVFDGGGHTIEVITRATPESAAGQPDARARFLGFNGSWGGYRADMNANRITYAPRGAVSPNIMGNEFSRAFELAGDTLTVTSRPGELHTNGVTRWTWERVPVVENYGGGWRQVVGFWEHVVEKRVNDTTGAVISESRRAPSVIVYTPSGYVGVHFPPLDRARFAAGEPTEAEAAAALRGYVGYFGALNVYPGMVFHQVLTGLSLGGNTLKRFYELSGTELNIRFPPTTNPDGQQTRTLVTLRRLSGEQEMLR